MNVQNSGGSTRAHRSISPTAGIVPRLYVAGYQSQPGDVEQWFTGLLENRPNIFEHLHIDVEDRTTTCAAAAVEDRLDDRVTCQRPGSASVIE